MMLSSLVRMESSVWRILRRRSWRVTLAVSAISSGEIMLSEICFSSTGCGPAQKTGRRWAASHARSGRTTGTDPRNCARVAAISSSSPIERMPPLRAWATMRRTSRTLPKRGLPFLMSSALMALVWVRVVALILNRGGRLQHLHHFFRFLAGAELYSAVQDLVQLQCCFIGGSP